MESLNLQLLYPFRFETFVQVQYKRKKKVCKALVDTGATNTIFNETNIQDIEAEKTQDVRLKGVSSTTKGGLYEVDITLVDFEKQQPVFKNHKAVSSERALKQQEGYYCLLGMDILKDLKMVYEPDTQILTLINVF